MTARTARVARAARTRPSEEAAVANAAMLAFAADLAERGERVELQGTVVNDHGAATVVAHCVVAALIVLAGLRWPLWSLIGLVLVAQSVIVDLDGGRGWVRRMAPRSISRNLLVWRGPVTSEDTHALEPTRTRGPQPVVPTPRQARRPVTVVCLPLEAVRFRSSSHLLGVPIALLGVGAGAILSRPLMAEIARGATVWTAAALGLCALIAWAARGLAPVRTDPSTGRALLIRLLDALDRESPERSDLVVALVGGGTLHNDGVEVLLRNHINRIPSDRARVIVWHPAGGPLRVVEKEGRVRKRPADVWLIGECQGRAVPHGWQTTGAGRAMRSGWRAMALAGAHDDPETVVAALHRLILAHDRQGRPSPGAETAPAETR